MKSTVIKRSVVVARRKTSISLEEEFWEGLRDIARAERLAVSELLLRIRGWHQGNLSSAVRVFVVDHYRAKAFATTAAEAFEMVPIVVSHEAQSL